MFADLAMSINDHRRKGTGWRKSVSNINAHTACASHGRYPAPLLTIVQNEDVGIRMPGAIEQRHNDEQRAAKLTG